MNPKTNRRPRCACSLRCVAIAAAAAALLPAAAQAQICPPDVAAGTSVSISGTVSNTGTCSILFGGSVTVQLPSGRLFNSGTLGNAGTLTNNNLVVSSSLFSNTGTFTNSLTGRFGNSGDLNNTGTITNQAGGSQTFSNSGTLNNSGTINNLGSGFANTGDLNNSGSFENRFSATFTNFQFHTLSNTGGFTNGGTFDNGGTLTTTGTFDNASIATVINRLGSTLSNAGTLTNRASATITNSDGATLINMAAGTLGNDGAVVNLGTLTNDGALWNGTNLVAPSPASTLTNHGTLNNNFRLINSGLMANELTFNNTGKLDNLLTFTNSGTLRLIGSSSVLPLAPAFDNSGFFGGTATLNNSGVLSVEGATSASGQGATLFNNYNGIINNSGNLQVGAGGFGFFPSGRLLSQGAINNLAGGVIGISGRLELVVPGTGSASQLSNAGLISSTGVIVIGGGIAGFADSVLSNTGTLELHGIVQNAGVVSNAGTLNNNSLIVNDGRLENAGTWTTGPGGVVSGAGIYYQSAGVLTVNGSMGQSSFLCDGGSVFGGGRIAANSMHVAPGCVVHPGNSPGTLTLDGGAAGVDFDGLLEIEIAGSSVYDILRVLGPGGLHFGSHSKVLFQFENYLPALGDAFDFIDGSSDGAFSFSFEGLGAGFGFDLVRDANGRLALLTTAAPDPGGGNVPVAGTLPSVLVALVGLALVRSGSAGTRGRGRRHQRHHVRLAGVGAG